MTIGTTVECIENFQLKSTFLTCLCEYLYWNDVKKHTVEYQENEFKFLNSVTAF